MINELPSKQFIQRLVSYYKTHTDSDCLPIWTGVYGPLRAWLVNEDLDSIRKKLDSIYIDDLWGIDYNQVNSWNIRPYETCFDSCLNLIASELQITNTSREDTIAHLENIVGIDLDMPYFPNRPVIKVGGREIPLRLLVCYYIFLCLRKNIESTPKNILEIGAGTGYFPYLFIEKYPTVKYNIVDLPVISVIQSYIYAKMMGEDKVWFHGEDETDAPLRIFAPGTIDDIKGEIDVALNLNSFPEIPSNIQSIYLNKIRQLLTPKGFFYSVNWEPHGIDQTPVKIACKNNGFKNTHRRLFQVESEVHPLTTIQFFEEVYKP